MTHSSGPLEGIKVLDLASVIMGPLASQHLADMGADVIKVEAPAGDLTRSTGPKKSIDMGAVFIACNRNKRSIVLDLKKPEAQAVLHRLVAGADVLIHNVRSAPAERVGLTPELLRRHNQRLIYCHAKGFSESGAYAGQSAFDDTIQAASGMAMLQTVIGGVPRYFPSSIVDKLCASQLAFAVTLALFHRERTGRGQDIEFPMFEVTAAFTMVEHLWGATFEPPIGSMGYESVRKGVRKPYPTKDGHLAFVPYSDAHWHRLFTLVGRPELIDDPRFSTFADRMKHPVETFGFLEETLRGRTTAEWVALLEKEDMPMSAVNAIEDLIDEPHLRSVGFWQMFEHPSEGMLRMAKNPLGLSDSPPDVRRLPPRLGEHTREVLGELAYDSAEIERLIARGVARQGPQPTARGA